MFSTRAEEHLSHIKQIFEKLCTAKPSMKFSQCHFFMKEIQHLGHILSTKGIQTITFKNSSHPEHAFTQNARQVCAFLGLVGYYRTFIKNLAKIAKPLTLLTHQQVKFDWTLTHHNTFLTLKESIIKALILWYPNPSK